MDLKNILQDTFTGIFLQRNEQKASTKTYSLENIMQIRDLERNIAARTRYARINAVPEINRESFKNELRQLHSYLSSVELLLSNYLDEDSASPELERNELADEEKRTFLSEGERIVEGEFVTEVYVDDSNSERDEEDAGGRKKLLLPERVSAPVRLTPNASLLYSAAVNLRTFIEALVEEKVVNAEDTARAFKAIRLYEGLASFGSEPCYGLNPMFTSELEHKFSAPFKALKNDLENFARENLPITYMTDSNMHLLFGADYPYIFDAVQVQDTGKSTFVSFVSKIAGIRRYDTGTEELNIRLAREKLVDEAVKAIEVRFERLDEQKEGFSKALLEAAEANLAQGKNAFSLSRKERDELLDKNIALFRKECGSEMLVTKNLGKSVSALSVAQSIAELEERGKLSRDRYKEEKLLEYAEKYKPFAEYKSTLYEGARLLTFPFDLDGADKDLVTLLMKQAPDISIEKFLSDDFEIDMEAIRNEKKIKDLLDGHTYDTRTEYGTPGELKTAFDELYSSTNALVQFAFLDDMDSRSFAEKPKNENEEKIYNTFLKNKAETWDRYIQAVSAFERAYERNTNIIAIRDGSMRQDVIEAFGKKDGELIMERIELQVANFERVLGLSAPIIEAFNKASADLCREYAENLAFSQIEDFSGHADKKTLKAFADLNILAILDEINNKYEAGKIRTEEVKEERNRKNFVYAEDFLESREAPGISSSSVFQSGAVILPSPKEADEKIFEPMRKLSSLYNLDDLKERAETSAQLINIYKNAEIGRIETLGRRLISLVEKARKAGPGKDRQSEDLARDIARKIDRLDASQQGIRFYETGEKENQRLTIEKSLFETVDTILRGEGDDQDLLRVNLCPIYDTEGRDAFYPAFKLNYPDTVHLLYEQYSDAPSVARECSLKALKNEQKHLEKLSRDMIYALNLNSFIKEIGSDVYDNLIFKGGFHEKEKNKRLAERANIIDSLRVLKDIGEREFRPQETKKKALYDFTYEQVPERKGLYGTRDKNADLYKEETEDRIQQEDSYVFKEDKKYEMLAARKDPAPVFDKEAGSIRLPATEQNFGARRFIQMYKSAHLLVQKDGKERKEAERLEREKENRFTGGTCFPGYFIPYKGSEEEFKAQKEILINNLEPERFLKSVESPIFTYNRVKAQLEKLEISEIRDSYGRLLAKGFITDNMASKLEMLLKTELKNSIGERRRVPSQKRIEENKVITPVRFKGDVKTDASEIRLQEEVSLKISDMNISESDKKNAQKECDKIKIRLLSGNVLGVSTESMPKKEMTIINEALSRLDCDNFKSDNRAPIERLVDNSLHKNPRDRDL